MKKLMEQMVEVVEEEEGLGLSWETTYCSGEAVQGCRLQTWLHIQEPKHLSRDHDRRKI